jgi:NAD(P)-dependent dehydrogenase (short-subunit alcohol dehydrogenase family)
MDGDSQLLAGKSVFVTGAARGLGAAIARASIEHGATVVLADVDTKQLDGTVAVLGPSARGVELDVTDRDAWARVAAELRATVGRPDVLVNNAGVVKPSPLVEATYDDFLRHLMVNVVGPFLGIRTYVELHRSTACDRPGSIVNIASSRGLLAGRGAGAYAASKFGVRGLTKVAALELGELGIRVNAVCPGPIETEMSVANPDFADVDWDAYVAQLPLGRIGRPVDIGEAVCWLGSDASAFVTGVDLPVDGGLTSFAISPQRRSGS